MSGTLQPTRDGRAHPGPLALLRRTAWLACAAAFLGSLAASVLALGASQFWLSDLVVHFRLQYLAIGVLALGLLAWQRRFVPAAAAALLVALNAPPVIGHFAGTGSPGIVHAAPLSAAGASTGGDTPPAARERLRIAAANVFFVSDAHADVLAWARRAQPDVVVFIEASPEWQAALAPLSRDYPHRESVTTSERDGMLLLSRWPMREPRVHPDGDLIAVTIDAGRASLRVVGVHAAWPIRPRNQPIRAAHFEWIAAEARAAARAGLPLVAIGDYNISPFSPHFDALLESSGLRNAAGGRGWQPTWPTFMPLLGIQIDHVLVSPDLQVAGFERGGGTGSDHRPVLVDLNWPI
jgi:endonuclease/exonuclease/phosphatase (EEP) superfamily protein YafD